MFRTRFAKDIVTEFLPPTRPRKRHRVIILCDGMPGIPRKGPLCEWLAQEGLLGFYPRYRGSWESDGEFLARSPHEDILDVVEGLKNPIREAAFGKVFNAEPDEVFIIGGSFGGATAILCSLDPRVKRVIANCPVVDWSILPGALPKETANSSYVAYIREAFGQGYRLAEKNWNKLYTGTFFNPAHHTGEIDRSKILDVPRQRRSRRAMAFGRHVRERRQVSS